MEYDFGVRENSWTTLFSLTLSTTLSFLQVFKLNRVGEVTFSFLIAIVIFILLLRLKYLVLYYI